jgi:hypothetical protein
VINAVDVVAAFLSIGIPIGAVAEIAKLLPPYLPGKGKTIDRRPKLLDSGCVTGRNRDIFA